MIVAQVKRFRLTRQAANDLSHTAFSRTVEWLSHWTTEKNFKAVIADSLEEALKMLREDMRKQLVPGWLQSESGVKPEHFEFEISEQETKEGRFWMPSCTVLCKWFPVKEN